MQYSTGNIHTVRSCCGLICIYFNPLTAGWFLNWFYFLMFTINAIFLSKTDPMQWIFGQHCGYWWLGALAKGISNPSAELALVPRQVFMRYIFQCYFTGTETIIRLHWCHWSKLEWLHWRHNGGDGVSNHLRLHCVLNCLFRRRSKKISKLCSTGLREGNPVDSPHKGPVTRIMFPFDDVIMWKRYLHHMHPHELIIQRRYSAREITKSSSTFSATNISSNIVWLLQLHDTIQMKYIFGTRFSSIYLANGEKRLIFRLAIVNLQRAKDGTHMFDAKYKYVFVVWISSNRTLGITPH